MNSGAGLLIYNMKINIRLLLVGAILMCPVSVHASEMAQMVAPAPNGALAPDAPVRFTLSSSIPKDQLNNLFVEFDGYDVTGMVQMDGLTVVYQPPQRLSPGNYLLRLVEKIPNGKFIELDRWDIRVAGPGIPSKPSVTGTLDGQIRHTVDEDQPAVNDEPGTSVRGNLQVLAKTGGEQWNAEGRANVFYDTVRLHNADKEHLDLGDYLLTERGYAGDLSTVLRLGNHDPGLSNMLVNNFFRRGASANIGLGDRAMLTGFAADPARATGWDNATGVTDSDQRVGGFFAKFYPFSPTYGDRIFLESGFYDGEGTIKSTNAGVAADVGNDGSGFTVAAQGQSLDDKWRLRGDYAHTRFDSDGDGTLVTSKSGDGYRTMLTFTPRGDLKTPDADLRQWTITALYQKTGTFFRSLANTTLPQDEERIDVASVYQHKTLNVTGEAYATRNNTDGDVSLPTDRTCGALAQASFSPAYFSNRLDPANWFTYSTFTFGGSLLDAGRQKTPSAFTGLGLDQASWSANAGWTAAFTRTTFSINDVYSGFEDSVTGTNSYNDNVATASLSWQATDRLTLTPSLQQEVKDQRDIGTQLHYFITLDSAATLVPGKLFHTFHYSALLDDGGPGTDQHNASTALTWQIRPAEKNRPGLALSLNGDYQHVKAGAAPVVSTPGVVTGENYRAYLQFSVSTPFGLW